MQANWSLILNVILLIGVVVAIGRLIKARRQTNAPKIQPAVNPIDNKNYDDIIAIRKLNTDDEPIKMQPVTAQPERPQPAVSRGQTAKSHASSNSVNPKTIMIFLQAKENRQLAGYELLQTVLAAGLRFGEGQLFHRHQNANGQGPILCSLAAATATGVFDLQNIGAFSVRGLCLFMQPSGNPTIDEERLNIMLDTAKQLSEGLDARLLDENQRPLTEQNMIRYYRMLNIPASEIAVEMAD